MDKEKKLEQLHTLKIIIEGADFQECVMQPLYKELEKITKLKDFKTWEEVLRAQGKEEGIKVLVNILKDNEREIKNIKFELGKD